MKKNKIKYYRVEGIWEISIPSPQFYYEPKSALNKHKVKYFFTW